MDIAKELAQCLTKHKKVVVIKNRPKLEKLWETAAMAGHLAELEAAWDKIDPRIKEGEQDNQCEECDGLGVIECSECGNEDADCSECGGPGCDGCICGPTPLDCGCPPACPPPWLMPERRSASACFFWSVS